MDEHEYDGGVHAAMEAAGRAALTIAMQVAERAARLREDLLRRNAQRSEAEAQALQSRFDGERRAAVAQLDVVHRPDWWEHADTREVAQLAETAQTWQSSEPRAAAALETIGRHLHDRYGIDLAELAAAERAKAAQDHTEAALLLAESDRLDRDGPDPSDGHQSGGDSSPGSARSGAAAGAAGVAYDSAERRDNFAASLDQASISAEDIAVRLRADTNQARPAHEAAGASRPRTPMPRSTTGPSRGRERGDRIR